MSAVSPPPADTHPHAGDPRRWADARPSKHEVAKHIIATALDGRPQAEALSGAELAARTPVSASTVRDLVAELRADGMAVVSFGSGYFQLTDDAVFREAMARQERAVERARETQQQLAAAYYGGEPV